MVIGSEQKKEAFLPATLLFLKTFGGFCWRSGAIILIIFRSYTVVPSSRAGYLTWQIP